MKANQLTVISEALDQISSQTDTPINGLIAGLIGLAWDDEDAHAIRSSLKHPQRPASIPPPLRPTKPINIGDALLPCTSVADILECGEIYVFEDDWKPFVRYCQGCGGVVWIPNAGDYQS